MFDEEYYEHLKGFGFSRFGKRPFEDGVTIEDMKRLIQLTGFGFSKLGKRDVNLQDLQHLNGFGFSKFGKRSKSSLSNTDLEQLKKINGFGFSQFGKRSPPNFIFYLTKKHCNTNAAAKTDVILNGFSFTNFGKRPQVSSVCQVTGKLGKREPIDGKDLEYLTGFGFSRVGKRFSVAHSVAKEKRKRDSIVGISQWGRKKRGEILLPR